MLTQDNTGVDEFIWLEDIAGEQPLAWVAEQNERTHQMLATPSFERTEQRILEVLDSDDRIPMVAKNGTYYYNFWRDAEHPRGSGDEHAGVPIAPTNRTGRSSSTSTSWLASRTPGGSGIGRSALP